METRKHAENFEAKMSFLAVISSQLLKIQEVKVEHDTV